jgi:hypothetical protein
MPKICDMGQDGFTSPPNEGVLRDFFFALKIPTASSGFEPANFGSKGQHSTSRPPKPLSLCHLQSCKMLLFLVSVLNVSQLIAQLV